VDDLLIIGKTPEVVKHFKPELAKRVSMKGPDDDDKARDYLGIEISRDRAKGTLRLSQKAYLQGVLKRYGLENLNGISAPMREGLRFYVDDTCCAQPTGMYMRRLEATVLFPIVSMDNE
jgi:hypothetical protein